MPEVANSSFDGYITGNGKENAIVEELGGQTALITMRHNFCDPAFPFYIGIHNHLPSVYNHDPQLHVRSFWKIFYVMEGKGGHRINDRVQPIRPGTIAVVHPGDRTSFFVETDNLILCNLCFKLELIGETLPRLKNDYNFFSIFSRSGSPDPSLSDTLYLLDADRTAFSLLKRILHEYNAEPPNYREMIRAQVIEFLIHIARLSAEGVQKESRMHAVRYINAWIGEHYAEEPDYKALAARIGISQGYMCTVYKELTGMTISGALLRRRLDAVCEGLADSRFSISELCYRCGFNDMSYFYKVFRARTGMTPRAWRLSLSSGKKIGADSDFPGK